MTPAPKTRVSVPLSEPVRVQTEQVNVAVEGLDHRQIPGSFKVHLLKDGNPIASRFMFQPSHGQSPDMPQGPARFDFLLPIQTVAGGALRVVVEPVDTGVLGARVAPEKMGNPTLRVSLMLERV